MSDVDTQGKNEKTFVREILELHHQLFLVGAVWEISVIKFAG